MKRILTTLAAIIAVCFCATAQQKGEQSIGIHLGYDTGIKGYKFFDPINEKVTTNDGHNVLAAVEYSYFVAKNLRLSATLSCGFQGNRDPRILALSLSIAPGIAYYVRIAPNFYYTPNLQIGFTCGMTDTGNTLKEVETMYMSGLAGELQPLAVEFRPTKKFAMSVSLCSLQGVAMQGKYDYYDRNNTEMSAMGLTFDFIKDAQVAFKFYF